MRNVENSTFSHFFDPANPHLPLSVRAMAFSMIKDKSHIYKAQHKMNL